MSYVLVSYVKLIYFQWIMFRELLGSVATHKYYLRYQINVNMKSLED